MARQIAVCSWSLHADSPAQLVANCKTIGVRAVQLALDPIRTGLWNENETVNQLENSDIKIVSGMMATKSEDYSTLETIRTTGGIRPDATWSANQAAARDNAALAQRLNISLVTFHAGFLPHDHDDPERNTLLDRLQQMHDIYASCSVNIAFETGQESASTLVDVLEALERPTVGVNFDPANMILYGMGDPIEALDMLAPRVAQIHIKDANPTSSPGTWGTEVRAGTGAVDWDAFFEVVERHTLQSDFVIEREARSGTTDDLIAARRLIEYHASRITN